MKVSENFWSGLKHLSKRYDADMKDIADNLFDSSDLKVLDAIYQGKRQKRRKSRRKR